MLVRPDDSAVHVDQPLDLADCVALGLGVGQQAVPGAVPAPANEPVVAGLPGRVPRGQITPGRSSAQLPQDAVHHLAVVSPPAAASPVLRQQRRDPRLCLVGEIAPLDHRLRPPLLVAALDDEKLAWERRAVRDTPRATLLRDP